MKTRIQMMNGLLNGTLTDEEKEVALANEIVVGMVEWSKKEALKNIVPKKKLKTKEK